MCVEEWHDECVFKRLHILVSKKERDQASPVP